MSGSRQEVDCDCGTTYDAAQTGYRCPKCKLWADQTSAAREDAEKAADMAYLEEAARSGNTAAMIGLAELLEGQREWRKGMEWWLRAAHAGNPLAIFHLSCDLGDESEAARWMLTSEAARRQDPFALVTDMPNPPEEPSYSEPASSVYNQSSPPTESVADSLARSKTERLQKLNRMDQRADALIAGSKTLIGAGCSLTILVFLGIPLLLLLVVIVMALFGGGESP